MTTGFDPATFVAALTRRPGVYRMLGPDGSILYVGKARDLKRRVASYFGSQQIHPKTQALMREVACVEVTVTATEQEALLLEYNLIKAHQPRYNVLLRDDKSYPFIYVSTQQAFPRFEFRRGRRRGAGRFLGPFPSAASVRETLVQVHKLFQVRQCSDAFFANRTRPCLQHQIGRCSAPCVDRITCDDYRRDVEDALLFLEGRNDAVLASLLGRMELAAERLDFERAATYRDQVQAIKRIQAEQVISGRPVPDTDVLAAHNEAGLSCITLLSVRGGRVLGTRDYFPRASPDTAPEELLGAFIAQHYPLQPPPREILCTHALEERTLLELALGSAAGHPVSIRHAVRGLRRRWLQMAAENARQAATRQRVAGAGLAAQFDDLVAQLGLPAVPRRIECFDVSHSGGSETMAACVVFGPGGPLKSDYRRFALREPAAGDDYAALAETVRRRYRSQVEGEALLPELILVDGGRGQLGRVSEVLDELGLSHIPLVGIAKGSDRRPGEERLWLRGESQPRRLAGNSPALHLLQQVRDEAHRFAITGHRQRRSRVRLVSTLEQIPGLGPARRRALLRHFGGLQGIRQAGVGELARVPGISAALAARIHTSLHGGED
ncbi:MAG: excinuclease ABC subunit UvrC [Chromatiales bacterium]|nr:excinuclease ABC subunit UvrC [Chromatiales bacterium]